MEINEAYSLIEKRLSDINEETGFKRESIDDSNIVFSGNKGVYRLSYDKNTSILQLECAYENNGAKTEFNTISRNLFEIEVADDRDIKSVSNTISDELERLFKAKKPVNLDKVKMPKAVSRNKAKNGIISYDVDSLANRFGVLYPDMKDLIKQNIADYDEFLPETFFMEYGTPRVLDVIKNGSNKEREKLFKMLGEVFEDGTNEVQDIIGVTILGEMKNDPDMMAVADKYMTEYMAGPVHEINKITAKNNRFTKQLKNPPAYKPNKQRQAFSAANSLNQN